MANPPSVASVFGPSTAMGDRVLFTKFKTTRAIDVIGNRPTIVVHVSDKVCEAWKKLIDNNILSVPVIEDGKGVGFVAVVDVVSFLFKEDKKDTRSPSEKLQYGLCGEVMNHSERDSFLRLGVTADLWTTCNVMTDFGQLHRLPIVGEKDVLEGLIAQSDIVRWVSSYIEENPIGDKTIQQLRLGLDKEVISIEKSKTAREAFSMILDYKISGIAVTGEFGELYGNLSATDFNHIVGPESYDATKLSLSVEEFMKFVPPNPVFGYNPIFITPVDSLKILVRKFVDCKIHRIYVVHDTMKLCGVISLIDFIKLLLHEAAPHVQ